MLFLNSGIMLHFYWNCFFYMFLYFALVKVWAGCEAAEKKINAIVYTLER
jgi:hypothetical protein